jgi:F1F0 ATPase subunit 2
LYQCAPDPLSSAATLATDRDAIVMRDLPFLVLMFISGMLLASIYLAGLWYTVQQTCTGRYGAAWFVASLIARISLLTFAFYFILGDGQWERLLAALTGFATLRTLAIYRVRRRLPRRYTRKERAA